MEIFLFKFLTRRESILGWMKPIRLPAKMDQNSMETGWLKLSLLRAQRVSKKE